MQKFSLEVIEGYGSKENPFIGGTRKTVSIPDIELDDKIRVLAVRIDQETKDESGVIAGSHAVPVVPYESINYLVGMLMTLAEASLSDPEQRKAFKDLLKQRVWQWYESQGVSGLPV